MPILALLRAARSRRTPLHPLTSLGVLLLAVSASPAQDLEALLKASADFNSVQVVYRGGVPHTDRNGNLLTRYDPQRSFLQVGVWGNPYGDIYGVNYDLKTLTDAGFNTMWPWPGHKLDDQLETGRRFGLQVVAMNALDLAEAAKAKDHPNWLGNVWCDEPTGSYWGEKMEGKYREFLEYKAKLNAAAPGRPVFVNDVPWVTPPATGWWAKWNTAGDVACHDNYPVMNRGHLARTLADEKSKSGIPTTVSLAAAVNKEAKPVWLIVGAFSQRTHGAFPFRFASPMQLRAQVYAGLIHGATGIIYFTWDTYVCRDGGVVGMSPDPRVAYSPGGPGRTHPTPVKPMELAESKAAWMAAAAVNRELRELTPCLLSPTAPEQAKYAVKTEGQSVTESPIRCLLKVHPEGGWVLLTVNLDDAVLKATYEFGSAVKSVQPLFEERPAMTLKPGAKSFDEMYDPFEVHAYRILPQ